MSARQASTVSSRVDSDKRDLPSQGSCLPHTVQPQPWTVRMLTEEPLICEVFLNIPQQSVSTRRDGPRSKVATIQEQYTASLLHGESKHSTQIRLLPCPDSWPQASLWINFNLWYSKGKEVERKEERDGSPSLSCDFYILYPPLSHTHTVTSHYTASLCSHIWPLHRSGRAGIPP